MGREKEDEEEEERKKEGRREEVFKLLKFRLPTMRFHGGPLSRDIVPKEAVRVFCPILWWGHMHQ